MLDDRRGALNIEQVHPSLEVDERALRQLIRNVLAAEHAGLATLTVVLADHDSVFALNRDYLGHDYITDVLSFDLGNAERHVDGEVYVDLDTAAERHDEFGTSFEREVHRYVVHGVLHLLGYDDSTPSERSTMRRLEDRYLGVER